MVIRSIDAHDVFQTFVNREAEVDRLAELIRTAEGGRLGAILAWPDSGLTASLRQAGHRFDPHINVVHIDLSNRQPDAMLTQAVQFVVKRGQEYARKILHPLARPGKRDVLRRLIGGSAGALPVVGSVASQLSDITFSLVSPDTDYLQYNRKLSDLFGLLAESGRTCIIADHFQKAQPNHVTQIANTLNANPSVSVLAAQNSEARTPSVQLLADALGPYLGALSEFPRPDGQLAKLILAEIERKRGITLSANNLPDIRLGLHAYLSRIYDLLLQKQSQPEQLLQIHLDIICTLKTAEMTIGASIVFNALVRGGLFVLDGAVFQDAISTLESHGLVAPSQANGLELSLALTSQGDARASLEMASGHRNLLYSELLYRGLMELIESGKLTAHPFAALLYRLAGVVDPDGQNRWKMATIKSCIATSDFFEASAILDRIQETLPRQSDDDTLTLIAATATTKRYDQALELCDALRNQNARTAILRSVLLYRCLKLDEALDEMKSLLSFLTNLEERCYLAVFFIALCIDRGQIDNEAKNLIASVDEFSETRHFGYLLNIIAATQTPDNAVRMCERSLASFERHGDDFGFGGARANVGVHLIKSGQFAESLEVSRSAHEHLSKYGIQHVHLVANNIASASLMIGDLALAEHWVRISLNLLQTSTIRVNALTNLAAIEFLKGRAEAMQVAIIEAARQAELQPIERVRSKACRNLSLLIDNRNGSPEVLSRICEPFPSDGAQTWTARPTLSGSTTEQRLEFLVERYVPPTNQYWYPNPMNLFERQSLSVETYG